MCSLHHVMSSNRSVLAEWNHSKYLQRSITKLPNKFIFCFNTEALVILEILIKFRI